MIYLPKSVQHGDSGWRAYQKRLQRDRRGVARLRKWRRHFRTLCILTALAVGGYLLVSGSVGSHPYLDDKPETPLKPAKAAALPQPVGMFSKSDLSRLVDRMQLSQLIGSTLEIQHESHRLTVVTTIDEELQEYLGSKLDLRHSRYIGIVAMEPLTGKILSLVGYNKEDPASNPCFDSSFPAASIFKIVTAAAAVEKNGLEPDSPLYFNGRKHTLYKSQLKEKVNRQSTRTTLKDSFAQSVNPVFGKLGALELGKKILDDYARAFGFNRTITFGLPLAPSQIEIDDDPYHWAEVASGFNNDTTLTPIHAAMIASSVLNGGRLMAPAIVERITDEDGRERYQNRPEVLQQAVSPATSEVIRALMETTVLSGTAKRQFRGARRDKVLSELKFGGKTGSINSRNNEARYDWFVGYAAPRTGGPPLAVAVMVAHENYIGTRATDYARLVFKKYFGRLAREADVDLASN